MNPFAGLMAPMVDRPCIERSERLRVPKVRKAVLKPRRAMVWVMNPWNLAAGQSSVMSLVVAGLSYDEIGQALGIKAKTVEAHLTRTRQKMGARSTLAAALMWDRWSREHQETKAEAVLFDGTAPGGDLQVSGV